MFGKRTGDISGLMGLVHDQLVRALLPHGRFSAGSRRPVRARFPFPILVLRHAMAAARGRLALDLITVYVPSGAHFIVVIADESD